MSEADYPRRLATVPQVAAYLGVGRSTVWSWVYGRRLPVIRINKAVRIDLNSLEKLLDEGTVPALDQ
jgi:excisionase family DNA binding protein